MVRRVCVGAMAVVLGWSVSVSAQMGSAHPTGAEEGASFAPRAAAIGLTSASPVELLLEKRIESVGWEEVTFDEVVTWLKDQGEGNVNIVPRWNALEQEDVNRDRLVTLKLNRATVGEVLSEVLDQLSETGEVTFRAAGNMLRISTKADLNRKLVLRTYLVTDVLFRPPDFSESAPQIDLQQQSGGTQGASGSSQPVFRNAGGQNQEELSEEGRQDPEKILDDLVTLIQQTIEPESWEEAGGRGRIKGFNKRHLVVLNTVEVHEMVAGYFSLD